MQACQRSNFWALYRPAGRGWICLRSNEATRCKAALEEIGGRAAHPRCSVSFASKCDAKPKSQIFRKGGFWPSSKVLSSFRSLHAMPLHRLLVTLGSGTELADMTWPCILHIRGLSRHQSYARLWRHDNVPLMGEKVSGAIPYLCVVLCLWQ